MKRSWSGQLTGRRAKIGIALAAALAGGVLAAFAIVLLNQQSGDRADIRDNFRDRATVSAALTQSLFEASSTQGQSQNARRYGTQTVSTRTMAQAAEQGQSTYQALIGPDGAVIAASPGTPQGVLHRLGTKPEDVAAVEDGKTFSVSNLLRIGKLETFELAVPIDTSYGKRVLVSGVSPELLAVFLGGYLRKVPNVGNGAAYLLDGNRAIIAATRPSGPPGSPPNTPGLVSALEGGDNGSFGDGQYFVTAAVHATPWEVVSTAPESKLFASVSGAHKWVPWLIFALLAVASAFALLLLARVLRNAGQLADANEQLEEANVALEQRAQELGRSNSELEQFASIASHDLKEPLRKVQTLTELLERKEADRLSDEGRDYLERTSAAGERMQELIDDLLKFSRVATQGNPFEEVDLRRVAEQAVSDLEAVIGETGGTVEVGDLPTVKADPLQMRQLLQNLISNALKFHREGVAPVVTIAGETRGRFAEFWVSDNGIGFEPRFNARIFKVFERLHGRGAYPGTGIGLALCRKIVDRHGGSITAESTPGEGSTFTVRLHASRPADVRDGALNGGAKREEGAPAGV
jgi:signal transduction histidine kinase